MRWYQKAGLSFVFGSGLLLTGAALFAACAGRSLGMGLGVLAIGVAALFANAPRLSGLLRRRAFRAVIRMRRGAGRAVAAFSAALALLTVDPVRCRRWALSAAALFVFLLLPDVVFAGTVGGTGPWVTAVAALCNAFDGPIGRGLVMVAVIIGGLMFAFGEGGSKSAIAGLVFGAGMVLGAPQFLTWIGLTATC